MAKSSKKGPSLHDALVLGLGLLDMTRGKVEKMVSEATKGITKQDKKKAVDQLFKYAASSRKKAEELVSKNVRKALDGLDLEVKRKGKKRG